MATLAEMGVGGGGRGGGVEGEGPISGEARTAAGQRKKREKSKKKLHFVAQTAGDTLLPSAIRLLLITHLI